MKPPNTQTQHAWQDALRHVRELTSRNEIDDSEWNELTGWLLESEFNGTSFLAGESAAILMRDRAPAQVKEQFDRLSKNAEGWPLYWRLIVQPEDHPDRLQTIERSCNSPILLIQQHGMIAMRKQPVVTN